MLVALFEGVQDSNLLWLLILFHFPIIPVSGQRRVAVVQAASEEGSVSRLLMGTGFSRMTCSSEIMAAVAAAVVAAVCARKKE